MNLKVRYWNVGLCLLISLTYFFGSERNVMKKSKSKNNNELIIKYPNNNSLIKLYENDLFNVFTNTIN